MCHLLTFLLSGENFLWLLIESLRVEGSILPNDLNYISQNLIESEQDIFGLGISAEEYNFYQITKGISTTVNNGQNSYFYKWSSETIDNHRAIYTFWDFLGDVGGLFDMLKLLG